MQQIAIPKPLKRYAGKIFMSFTWYDIPFIVATVICIILVWALGGMNFNTPSYWIQFVITFLLIIGCIVITIPINGIKSYVKLWRLIRYIFSKKGYLPQNKDMLIPYKEIEEGGFIKLKTGGYIKVIELTGFNLSILQEQEQLARINSLRGLTRQSNLNYSFVKLKLPSSLQEQKDLLTKAIKIAKKPSYKKALEWNLKLLDVLEIKEQTQVDKYFILLYGDKNYIQENIITIMSKLEGAYLMPREASESELKEFINGFYVNNHLDIFNEELNVKFASSHIEMNGKFIRIYGITQFPRFGYEGWLEALNLDVDSAWNIKISTYDKIKATKKLDRVINDLDVAYLSTKKASQETSVSTYKEGLKELNDLVHADGENILNTYTFIRVTANSLKELKESCGTLVSSLHGRNFSIDPMKHLQLEAFESMLPKPTLLTKSVVSLELPSVALAMGFPFYSEVHKDKEGIYIGTTNSGHNVIFDPWQRDSNRQNSNIVTFGSSGSGKSTLSKKLIKDQVIIGRKIFAIDPEREYQKLCHNLDGSWVNFGTNRLEKSGVMENVINPLQFLKNETGERSILSAHLQFLEQFFMTLFPSIQLSELSILRRVLAEVYGNFKITSINSFKITDPKKFPIMSDVVKLIKKKIKQDEDPYETSILKSIHTYFECFVLESPEEKLWNAHTNFDIHASDFIVMDTQELSESGNKRIANAQMFILLKIVNNAMVQNKILKDEGKSNQKMMIVIDEAHLLVDETQPAALEFMYQMVKRARKYDAMTLITTQNIKDFVGGSSYVKQKTSAILNTSQYTFMLKMNSGDIDDLDKVYSSTGGLTSLEKETLSTAKTGRAIMAIGSKDRKIVQIDIAQEEMELWE